MILKKHITASVSINNGVVIKNSKPLFENKEAVLTDFLSSVYQHFNFHYPKFYKMDRMSKLGWLASELLLSNGFKKDNYKPEEIGVFLANTNSSLDNDLKYSLTIKDIPSPSVFVYTLPNIVIGEICIRNSFKGEHAFYIQDEFDSAFLEMQLNYLMDNGYLQAAICGWVDVLNDEYKALLFLVEKKQTKNAVDFSALVMRTIFEEN